jgi:tripartite-type tricarboxylate transporter receptor subunit TctC
MKLSRGFLFALAMVCWFGQAAAQSYPTKPVTILVPFAPGGATDIVARITAQALSDSLGQAFVVDNRPGVGGMLALEQVAKATPDGYTLLLPSTGPATISPVLYKSRRFDPLARLDPVILIGGAPGILLVRNGLNARSVKELLALSRAAPGALNMASAGSGSIQHLLGEYFQSDAGVKWTHVPYKGSAPALAEMVGGRVDVMFDVVPSAAPFVKAGNLRALAVSTQKRSSQLPEVPTLEELGFPGYDITGWQGLLAPKGTPPDVILKLNAAVNKALQTAEMKAKLAAVGTYPDGGSPEVLGERMRAELRNWAKAIQISGAVAE